MFFFSKSALQIIFSDSHSISIKLIPTSRSTCWIMTMAWGKKILYECAACVCRTFGTISLVIAFFMALGFLTGVMTISFALPIDLFKSLPTSEIG